MHRVVAVGNAAQIIEINVGVLVFLGREFCAFIVLDDDGAKEATHVKFPLIRLNNKRR